MGKLIQGVFDKRNILQVDSYENTDEGTKGSHSVQGNHSFCSKIEKSGTILEFSNTLF